MPVENPVRCVSKIGSKVKIPIKTERIAIEILGKAKQGVASGKNPMGLAAAALYVASVLDDVKKTQKEIAEVANVTEVTVRNRYRDLKETLKLNI
jgi:transcription initiation factor TFIIB